MYSVLVILPLMFGYVMANSASGTSVTQTLCPVMGGEINKAIYADYEGRRVYFCCNSCIDVFKNDPEKYIKQLEEQDVRVEKANESSQKYGTGHSSHEGGATGSSHGGCGCGS
jgi:YHS domain-containing protein